MNYQLFSAFLFITLILVLTPGPVVTLVISTGATQGTRAGLFTVAGSTLGNALLIGTIALGLNVVIRYTAEIFELLRGGRSLSHLARHPGLAACRRPGCAGRGTAARRLFPPRHAGYWLGGAAGAGRTFFLRRASAKWLGRISGLTLIGGGVWLSLAKRPG